MGPQVIRNSTKGPFFIAMRLKNCHFFIERGSRMGYKDFFDGIGFAAILALFMWSIWAVAVLAA